MTKYTIRQVANIAGVSPATVSRVLSGNVRVSDELRDKVLKTASQVGYTAQQPGGAQKMIYVIFPNLSNPFYNEILDGVLCTAAKAGYHVMITSAAAQTAGSVQNNLTPPENGAMIAGVISMLRLDVDNWLLKTLPGHIPVVQCCEYNEALPYPFVSINNYEAAYNATTHLINMGRRNLAFFNSSCDTLYGKERERGFLQAMSDHSVPVNDSWVLHLREIDYNLALAAAKSLFANTSAEKRPDAVFTVSDVYALGVIKSAVRLGLSVPTDVSVVGFDDIEIALMSEPSLTTIRQPRFKLGSTACSILLQWIHTGSVPSQHFWVEADLVVRESTASKLSSISAPALADT